MPETGNDEMTDLAKRMQDAVPGRYDQHPHSHLGKLLRVGDWLTVSDGIVLVATKNDQPATTPPVALLESFRPLLAEPERSAPQLDYQALCAWAGPPWLPCECSGAERSCYACDGAGNIDHSCAQCGHEHACLCDNCDGGVVMCRDCGGTGRDRRVQYGWLYGSLVDRRRVAQVLQVDQAEHVRVWMEEPPEALQPIIFRWGALHAVVMPMRAGSRDDGPRFP